MSEKEKQLKNGFWYFMPVIVSNFLPIATLPIFTRILTVDDYGVYGLAMAYAIFVNGIANFGLSIGYERNFFENDDLRKRAGLLFSTVVFVLITFSIFAALTFIFKSQLSEWIFKDRSYGYVLFWAYSGAAVMALKMYFLTYFKNTEDAKSFVTFTISESILLTIFSVFLISNLKIGVLGLVLGQFLASTIICLILIFLFFYKLPFNLDLRLLRSSLRLSLPLTPRIFFGILGNEFDKYMIGLLSSLGGVGVYNLGQKIANVNFTFMTAIQNVFAPQVYKRMFEMKEESSTSIGMYLTPFLYISTFFGLALALFSEEVITLLTPKSFHGAIDIVSILCLLSGTHFFGKQPQLIFAKKTGLISILTLVGILLNIVCNIPFIYRWGAIGAAWGTLVAGITSGLIYFYFSQKYYRIDWEYSKIIKIFLLFFGFVIITMLLRNFQIVYQYRLPIKFIFLLIFIRVGNQLNVVTKGNILMIKNLYFPKY